MPSPRRGEIGGNIGRSPRDRKRMALVSRGGKPALTRYRVRASYGSLASLLECRLSTGRTHQIRVHLAARGHPVMGDPLYGRATAARKAALPSAARAALAGPRAPGARMPISLAFEHPASRKKLRFEKDIPKDINRPEKVPGRTPANRHGTMLNYVYCLGDIIASQMGGHAGRHPSSEARA